MLTLGWAFAKETLHSFFDITVNIICRANKEYDFFIAFPVRNTFESFSSENGAGVTVAGAVALFDQEVSKSDITNRFLQSCFLIGKFLGSTCLSSNKDRLSKRNKSRLSFFKVHFPSR